MHLTAKIEMVYALGEIGDNRVLSILKNIKLTEINENVLSAIESAITKISLSSPV